MKNNTEGRIVMLVDDSEIDNYINKKFIEDRGIATHVIVMGTADKALKYLKDQKNNTEEIPDIILLDINLPAINGYGFLEEFIKLPEPLKEKCKIAILSSSDKDEDFDQMKSYEIVKKYFVKPISDEALMEIKDIIH